MNLVWFKSAYWDGGLCADIGNGLGRYTIRDATSRTIEDGKLADRKPSNRYVLRHNRREIEVFDTVDEAKTRAQSGSGFVRAAEVPQ